MILSIIIPCYNVGKYIDNCLNSIYHNALCDDFEVICVNDGSTDDTLCKLKKWESEKKNFTVLTHDNMGASFTRNRGADAAEGEYIWYIDSDDFIVPNSLNLIIAGIKEHAPEIVIMKNFHTVLDCERAENYGEIKELDYILTTSDKTTKTLWSCIYKKYDGEEKIYIDSRLTYGEDTYYNYLQYLKLIERDNGCLQIETPIYCYRQNPVSLTNTVTAKAQTKHTKDIFLLCRLLKSELDQFEKKEKKKINYTKEKITDLTIAGLQRLPYSSLDLNKTLSGLRECGLYPFAWSMGGVKSEKKFKMKIWQIILLFLRFECFYRLYYKKVRRGMSEQE